MGLRKKLELDWKGETYKLLVTMDVIENLEEEINLSQLNLRVARGDVRFSQAAKLVALVLNEAGAEASTEDVYTELHDPDGCINARDLLQILNMIFSAVFPEPKKKSKPTEAEK